jgi:DNA primase
VDKTFYLWGAARRTEFYEGKTVVLTEGALDALWLRQNGYPHAFAILGSFMSYGQVSKLERMNPARIILCFDNDKAGYDCTVTSGKMLMKSGFSHVYYLKYPNKQATDPPKCSKAQLDRMFKRRNSVRPLANEFPTSRRMQHLLRSA